MLSIVVGFVVNWRVKRCALLGCAVIFPKK